MAYTLGHMAYGLWLMAYGIWHVAHGMWHMAYSLWLWQYHNGKFDVYEKHLGKMNRIVVFERSAATVAK